jgi:hypothetical protein
MQVGVRERGIIEMDKLRMFVNGQAMSGGDISIGLKGALLLGEISTSASYKFYSFRREFPGLHRVAVGGTPVPGELYAVTYEILIEQLLPLEPDELELGCITLEDGSGSLAMVCRLSSLDLPGVLDISSFGGWKNYLRSSREFDG